MLHGLILFFFIIYCFFGADLIFDRFERIPGESKLCKNVILDNINSGIMYNLEQVHFNSSAQTEVGPWDKKAILQDHVDECNFNTTTLELTGWAYIERQNAEENKIFLVLQSDSDTYVFDTQLRKRPDVTFHFKEFQLNLDDSGFLAIIPLRKVEAGNYVIGIYIKKGGIETLEHTNKILIKTEDSARVASRPLNQQETSLHVSNLKELKLPTESNNMRFRIEILQDVMRDGKLLFDIKGWTFIKDQNMVNTKIFIVLKSDSLTYVYDTMLHKRPDVTVAFGESELNLDNSGFSAFIPKEEIKNGTYELGLYIMNGTVKALQYTNERIHL